MIYRTKTYLAGDWTGDSNLIQTIISWNESDRWSLHFTDVHKFKESYDTSLPCSIKRSLSERMNMSKTFVLIVGDNTNNLTKGSCQYCSNYRAYSYNKCSSNMHVDYRSFVQYECEKAARDELKIVIIYNYCSINKTKCPEILRNCGTHIPAVYQDADGQPHWDYYGIKRAFEK